MKQPVLILHSARILANCRKFPILTSNVKAVFILILFASILGGVCLNADWRPIPQEHLDATEPSVDPEAGAEYLFMEQHGSGAGAGVTITEVYSRVKIFTEKGVDDYVSIVIPYRGQVGWFPGDSIRNLRARVISSDGTITELDTSDFSDQLEQESRYNRLYHRSVAIPRLEPGSILETQYRVDSPGTRVGYVVYLARSIPIQHLVFRFRHSWDYQVHRVVENLGVDNPFVDVGDRTEQMELRNIPAMKSVPHRPPVEEISPWYGFSYTRDLRLSDPLAYWVHRAQRLADLESNQYTPRNRAVRQATSEATNGVSDPMEKLRRIYDYVQREITNMNAPGSDYTAGQREDRRRTRNPSITLRESAGTSFEINALFASMAGAAGFDVRFAGVGDRSQRFFHTGKVIFTALRHQIVAVNHEDQWFFFDPGTAFLPFGELEWENTGTAVLLAHRRRAEFQATPPDMVGDSRIEREAHLSLDEEGTLRGTITVRYHGQEARIYRRRELGAGIDELEDRLRDSLQERLPRTQVSEVSTRHMRDSQYPPELHYQVEIPGYGDLTSRRMFFKPSYFRAENDPWFTEETRDYDIYFRYPRSFQDTVNLELPEGFTLEMASAPASAGDNQLFSHQIQLGVAPDGRLVLQRNFAIKNVLVPKNLYPAVKSYFELVSRQDNHLLSLLRTEEDSGVERDALPTPSKDDPVITEVP